MPAQERPPLAGCSQAGFGFSRRGTLASRRQEQEQEPQLRSHHRPCQPLLSPTRPLRPTATCTKPHPNLWATGFTPTRASPATHGCLHMAFSSQSFWELGGRHRPPDSGPQPSRGSPRRTTDQHRAGRPDRLVWLGTAPKAAPAEAGAVWGLPQSSISYSA